MKMLVSLLRLSREELPGTTAQAQHAKQLQAAVDESQKQAACGYLAFHAWRSANIVLIYFQYLHQVCVAEDYDLNLNLPKKLCALCRAHPPRYKPDLAQAQLPCSCAYCALVLSCVIDLVAVAQVQTQ